MRQVTEEMEESMAEIYRGGGEVQVGPPPPGEVLRRRAYIIMLITWPIAMHTSMEKKVNIIYKTPFLNIKSLFN